jgi:general secretion pathway protein F
LDGVNASIARRVSRGAALEDALERDPAVPAWYRCLVLLGLRTHNMEGALDVSNRMATTIDDSRQTAVSAFYYPLIVCGLAYLGMIGFCLFLVPTLEKTFYDLRLQPGPGLRTLLAVRDAMPFWIAVPPVLLLLWFLWRRLVTRNAGVANGRWMWLPGMSRSISQARWASFAETLAMLEASGMPIKESLPLAACSVGDTRLNEAGWDLAAGFDHDAAPSDDTAAAKRFPPFLRWAILQSDATIGRKRALEMAARVYRLAAERSAERSRILTPIFVCVILGGGVTLLYALSVFVPVVELLYALASA